jgi:hypothetical protein
VSRQFSGENPGFLRPHGTDHRCHFPFTHPIQDLDYDRQFQFLKNRRGFARAHIFVGTHKTAPPGFFAFTPGAFQHFQALLQLRQLLNPFRQAAFRSRQDYFARSDVLFPPFQFQTTGAELFKQRTLSLGNRARAIGQPVILPSTKALKPAPRPFRAWWRHGQGGGNFCRPQWRQNWRWRRFAPHQGAHNIL